MLLSVCPHDIVKQMQTWLEMSAYLARRLERPVQLRRAMDFREFYEDLDQTDLAFVNPMDAWYLSTEHGFLPVCQTELYDEVVFFTSAGSSAKALSDLSGKSLGAVEHQFATYLGLYVLWEQKIEPGAVRFLDSWIQVIRQVVQGEVPYGLLYKDFFTGLSSLTRSMIQVIHESQTGYATHVFLIHPRHKDLQIIVGDVLKKMVEDSEGRNMVNTLKLGRWVCIQDLATVDKIISVVKNL